MEFTSRDRSKAWAVIVRLDHSISAYTFKARGLDTSRNYRVVFDSSSKGKSISGALLADTGLSIRPSGSTVSELLLFTM